MKCKTIQTCQQFTNWMKTFNINELRILISVITFYFKKIIINTYNCSGYLFYLKIRKYLYAGNQNRHFQMLK